MWIYIAPPIPLSNRKIQLYILWIQVSLYWTKRRTEDPSHSLHHSFQLLQSGKVVQSGAGLEIANIAVFYKITIYKIAPF